MAVRPASTKIWEQHIPHEIQFAIVDEIYHDLADSSQSKEKHSVLSKCCLVSSKWLLRARHWMFSDFGFVIENDRQTSQFIEFLQSPHSSLKDYVHHLVIYGPDVDWGPLVYGSTKEYDVLNTFVAAALTHLNSNTIHKLEFFNLIWNCLTEPVRECIQQLSQVVYLTWTEVTFKAMKWPDVLLLCSRICPYLEVLGFQDRLFLDPQPVPLPAIPTVFPHLHTLFIEASSITAPLLSKDGFSTLTTLEKLVIHPESKDDFHLLCSFVQSARHLRHLTIWLPELYRDAYDDPVPFPLSFHMNSRLATLELVISIDLTKDIGWLSRILSTATTATLDVHIKCGYLYQQDIDLSPLERSLSGDKSKTRRLHLKRANIDTKLIPSWFDYKEQLLPELFRSGRLFW